MSTEIEVEAYCSQCERVTDHVATYVEKFLKRTKCSECGHELDGERARLLLAYLDDAVDRALSKPYRMRQEWKESSGGFLQSLPGRIISRPIRELRKLADLFGRE
jgi:Zn ribbon nucleic-acid-binding protein